MDGSTRGRPRAEPREEQRRRIVDAARVAFAEHGYEGVTLSSIAADARVPRAVVYEVIGSKEHLLGAVADQLADELIAAVDERFSAPDAADRPLEDLVRDDVRWFLATIGGDPTVSAIRLSGRLVAGADDANRRARRRIEDRLTQLHADRARHFGVEREASARMLAIVVLGMLESVSLRMGEGDEAWPPDAVATLVTEFALGGYLRTEIEGVNETFDRRADRST